MRVVDPEHFVADLGINCVASVVNRAWFDGVGDTQTCSFVEVHVYKKFLLIVCALVLPHVVNAQTKFLSSEQEVRNAAEGIVASLTAGKPDEAMKEIRPLSVIASTELDVFEVQLNNRHAVTLGQSGAATGYEFLREDRVGTRLLRQQFMVFYEKAPQRWSFVFYRTERGWVLSQFAFGGNAMSFFPAGG